MKIQRTYPQPDSPQPNIGPRERAMAVLKYLLDIEPEVAIKHHVFPLLVASYEQSQTQGWNLACDSIDRGHGIVRGKLAPSIVELLTAETEGTMRAQPFSAFPGLKGNPGEPFVKDGL